MYEISFSPIRTVLPLMRGLEVKLLRNCSEVNVEAWHLTVAGEKPRLCGTSRSTSMQKLFQFREYMAKVSVKMTCQKSGTIWSPILIRLRPPRPCPRQPQLNDEPHTRPRPLSVRGETRVVKRSCKVIVDLSTPHFIQIDAVQWDTFPWTHTQKYTSKYKETSHKAWDNKATSLSCKSKDIKEKCTRESLWQVKRKCYCIQNLLGHFILCHR